MTTPTPAPDPWDIRGIIEALDPEHKIKVTKTEVADFLERALRASKRRRTDVQDW